MNEGGTPEGVHRTSVQKGQLRLLRLMAGASGPVHLPREGESISTWKSLVFKRVTQCAQLHSSPKFRATKLQTLQ